MNNTHIPKIIHMSWITKDVLSINSPLIENGVKNLFNLNKDWTITVSTDEEVDYYLKCNLLKDNYILIKDNHIVAKTDLWRLYKIYNEGGMYIDIDRLVNIPMDNILNDNFKWLLPINNIDFSHDIMISAPNNPVYEKCINLYFNRVRQGITDIYYLGPQTYMHSITLSIFNTIMNSNPGEQYFISFIKSIKSATFIKPMIEYPPVETILYNGDITKEEHEDMKRQLYKDCGLKHWTGSW